MWAYFHVWEPLAQYTSETWQESLLQFTITYTHKWSLFKKRTQFRNRMCPLENLMNWSYVWWSAELLWPTTAHSWLSATVCENLCTNRRWGSGRHVLWMPEQTKTDGLNSVNNLRRVYLYKTFKNKTLIYMYLLHNPKPSFEHKQITECMRWRTPLYSVTMQTDHNSRKKKQYTS